MITAGSVRGNCAFPQSTHTSSAPARRGSRRPPQRGQYRVAKCHSAIPMAWKTSGASESRRTRVGAGEPRQHRPHADPLAPLARCVVGVDEQREPGTAVALAEQHAAAGVRRVGRREPRDPAVDGPDPGAGDDEHPRLRIAPASVEPGLVDAPLTRPVVRVGRQIEVREAHGMRG